MTIYFNNKKQACAFEIADPIATVDDETWETYCSMQCGEDYDIIDGQFVALRTPEEHQAIRQAVYRILDLKKMLKETDWVVVKLGEYIGTLEYEEMRAKYADVIAQRQAWREEINDLEDEYGEPVIKRTSRT